MNCYVDIVTWAWNLFAYFQIIIYYVRKENVFIINLFGQLYIQYFLRLGVSIQYEWAKRTMFLLAIVYIGWFDDIQTALKLLKKIGKN